MTKKELRTIYSNRRLALTQQERLKLDDLLLIQFQRLSFADISYVLSYLPIEARAEMDTHIYTDYLKYLIPGLGICYPLIDIETRDMDPVLVNDDEEFVLNAYGISEPLNGNKVGSYELDLIIAPLLAFDDAGYRVGYGKGFYDRFLKKCRADVILIGFSYFEPVSKIDDTNQFDVPLNYCITPQKVYEF